VKLGAHIWIGEGLLKTIEVAEYLGCDCFQIFLHNPRSWEIKKRNRDEIIEFRKVLKEKGIEMVVVHMPYILNLSSPDKEISLLTMKKLEKEIEESEEIGASYYVIHPGSHKGEGIESGWKRLVNNLKKFKDAKVKILIENTSGQGNLLGSRWEEFKYAVEKLDGDIGICFDTAHAFQSGYRINTQNGLENMKKEIEKNFPLGYIHLIHANDSATECGSKKDRHYHIGKGFIGMEGFESIIKDGFFGNLPFIIETPKSTIEKDKENLRILRKIGEKYGKV